MSETFSTLHGLVNKGVNVVMDIPYELWNETSAEVADLKKQVCLYIYLNIPKGTKIKLQTWSNFHLLNEICVCVCAVSVM